MGGSYHLVSKVVCVDFCCHKYLASIYSIFSHEFFDCISDTCFGAIHDGSVYVAKSSSVGFQDGFSDILVSVEERGSRAKSNGRNLTSVT